MSTSFLVSTMYPHERTEKWEIGYFSLPPSGKGQTRIVCARYWFVMLHDTGMHLEPSDLFRLNTCFPLWAVHVFFSVWANSDQTGDKTQATYLDMWRSRIIFLFPTYRWRCTQSQAHSLHARMMEHIKWFQIWKQNVHIRFACSEETLDDGNCNTELRIHAKNIGIAHLTLSTRIYSL
jgi:hypothetical protein